MYTVFAYIYICFSCQFSNQYLWRLSPALYAFILISADLVGTGCILYRIYVFGRIQQQGHVGICRKDAVYCHADLLPTTTGYTSPTVIRDTPCRYTIHLCGFFLYNVSGYISQKYTWKNSFSLMIIF